MAKRAFTIVELLVMTAVIAMLVATLIPAINSARESARRTWCVNNLKQLGIAASTYETTQGVLPPGYLGPNRFGDDWLKLPNKSPGGLRWIGTLVYLLPYLEQQAVSRAINDRMELTVDSKTTVGRNHWYFDVETRRFAKKSLAAFLCPSDDPSRSLSPIVAVHTFLNDNGRPLVFGSVLNHVLLGSSNFQEQVASERFGTTNYAGCAGQFGVIGETSIDLHRGAFTNRSAIRIVDVKDGTSKTLAFGETLGTGHDNSSDIRTHPFSWIAIGALPLVDSIGGRDTPGSVFNSRHPGFAHFSYLDGAVRPISKEIRTRLLVALGGIHNDSRLHELDEITTVVAD